MRIYRQGFGDCFLLAFRGSAAKVRYVLIDCGLVLAASKKKEILSAIVQDILNATGRRVDVLVVTHEHYDHVSGFKWAQELFDSLKVGTVWVAWTEDKADPLAQQIGDQRDFTVSALSMAVQAGLGAAPCQATREALLHLGFFGKATATRSAPLGFGRASKWSVESDSAMTYAVSKVTKPEYLVPGRILTGSNGIEGVRVYVLGPPRNLARLRDIDPTAGSDDAYLARPRVEANFFMAGVAAMREREGQPGGSPASDESLFPFARWLRVPESQARGSGGPLTTMQEFLRRQYFGDPDTGSPDRLAWRRIDRDWLRFADRLALQLDNMTNNTSLALAFELVGTGRVLLFPGDAQTGNWESWHDVKFRLPSGTVSDLDNDRDGVVTAEDILAATVLYKVGHHGSHNGTHRARGLERMINPNLVAVVPVDHDHAIKSGWPKIPWKPLMDRLHQRTRGRVLVTQKGQEPPPGDRPPAGCSAAAWRAFHKTLTVEPGGLYYDLVVQGS